MTADSLKNAILSTAFVFLFVCLFCLLVFCFFFSVEISPASVVICIRKSILCDDIWVNSAMDLSKFGT